MPDQAAPVEIGLVLSPGAQPAAVHGLTDLFAVANRTAMAEGRAGLRVSHWARAEEGAGLVRVFDTHAGCPGSPRVLVAPPSLGDPPPAEALAPYAAWLKARHKEGAVLASVCAGAFLIAETGLLSGRPATAHPVHRAELAARFPEVRVETGRRLVDDGDILTAGGLMAWTSLGLKLVDRLLGPRAAEATARLMELPPPEPGAAFAPRLDHGDGAVLKVQHLLHASGARGATVAAMAAHAGLEERTFLRRFRKATGLSPAAYGRRLRLAEAQDLLAAGAEPADRIAWAVGYADPAAFRKAFQRVTGVTPAAYRRRARSGRAEG